MRDVRLAVARNSSTRTPEPPEGKSRRRMSPSVSSFASKFILIVAAEGEVTSPPAATITMEIEANLETLDDIRCQWRRRSEKTRPETSGLIHPKQSYSYIHRVEPLLLRDTVAAKTRTPSRVSLGAVQCETATTTVRSNKDN